MSAIWLAPLSIGLAGAVALGLTWRRLSRQVEALQKSMRPLRVERSRRQPR